MNELTTVATDLDDLALALVHWLEAHAQASDPAASSRSLEEARRRVLPYLPGYLPTPRKVGRRGWLAFW